MPLRDHFQPPVSLRAGWDSLHAMWPAVLVQHLRPRLPHGYVALPGVHHGSPIEIDVGTYESDDAPRLQGYDEFEVRIYDADRGRQLVAAIELVSPGNKDRPEKRNAFVAMCAALMRQGVAVSIVDVVTPRQFNLYAELMEFLGQPDPIPADPAPHLYAVSCRLRPHDKRMLLQTWFHALVVGQPLPTLPLWLAGRLAVPLDLEPSYEQACQDLSIT